MYETLSAHGTRIHLNQVFRDGRRGNIRIIIRLIKDNLDVAISGTFVNKLLQIPNVRILYKLKDQFKNQSILKFAWEIKKKYKRISFLEIPNLKCNIYIIRKKISKSIRILYKIRDLELKSRVITIYYSFIYPYFLYYVPIRGSKTHI